MLGAETIRDGPPIDFKRWLMNCEPELVGSLAVDKGAGDKSCRVINKTQSFFVTDEDTNTLTEYIGSIEG